MEVTKALLGVCEDLYLQHPGDDTTVATTKVTQPRVATLFSGPPIDKAQDDYVVKKLMKTPGKKIVCGGTAANIVSRILKSEVTTSLQLIDPCIPPIGLIKGIDLVTEGVLTLQSTVEKLEHVKQGEGIVEGLEGEDGASILARILLEECTHIQMIIGRAINPAHQNLDFPQTLSIKLNMLSKLEKILMQLGKVVQVEYV